MKQYISILFSIFIIIFTHNFSYASKISNNYDSICIVQESGTPKCSNPNLLDQIGNGIIENLEGETQDIDIGSLYSCALTINGNVKCLGQNNYGQLGNGTNHMSSTAIKVKNLNNIKYMSTGFSHACAIDNNGIGKCWGDNISGQLGNGKTDPSTIPVNIQTTDKFKKIVAGYNSTCALTEGKQVKCWGDNSKGQLGNATTKNSLIPVNVVGLPDNIKDIDLSFYYGCALTEGNQVKCWGDNSNGQLGLDIIIQNKNLKSTIDFSTVPIEVKDYAKSVSKLSVGRSMACVLLETWEIECWGMNISLIKQKNILNNQHISMQPILVKKINKKSFIDFSAKYNLCIFEKNNKVECLDDNVKNKFQFYKKL